MIHIRLEDPSTNRVSKQYDFPLAKFVQLTFEDLRLGPDGEVFAFCDDNVWYLDALNGTEEDGWSDVIIWYEQEN